MAALEDKVNTGTLLIIGVVGSVITFLIVMVLRVSYYNMVDSMQAERGNAGMNLEERNEIRAEQREALESYGWVDREAGTVRIPIEDAKKLVLKDLAN